MQLRDEHTAVVCQTNGLMIVFGGYNEGARTNDIIIYNFSAHLWTKVKLAEGSPKPCPRSGHSAVLHQGDMYVFGGKDEDANKLQDLWKFNYNQLSWEKLTQPNLDHNLPMARSGHSAALYGDFIVIFGGIYEVTKELNDLYAYSIQKNQWITIQEPSQSPRGKSPNKHAVLGGAFSYSGF